MRIVVIVVSFVLASTLIVVRVVVTRTISVVRSIRSFCSFTIAKARGGKNSRRRGPSVVRWK